MSILVIYYSKMKSNDGEGMDVASNNSWRYATSQIAGALLLLSRLPSTTSTSYVVKPIRESPSNHVAPNATTSPTNAEATTNRPGHEHQNGQQENPQARDHAQAGWLTAPYPWDCSTDFAIASSAPSLAPFSAAFWTDCNIASSMMVEVVVMFWLP
mmetsp:Transcript_516/g.819  ORF Transcript_516/g.819 Transcript_516/m.819 type:complete len:156 (+) Transcript_516:24-491(+)